MFTVEPLAGGAYDVRVHAQGYSPLTRRGLNLAAAQRFSLVLELDGTASASGTVRDADGNPVADAVVEGGPWFGGPFTWGRATPVRTAADGTYRIGGLEAGLVRLRAGHDVSQWLASRHVELQPGQEAHVDFVLHELGALVGRVTLASGAPLLGDAVVRAMPRDTDALPTPSDMLTAVVGADGRYNLQVPAGRYSVRAYSADAHGLVLPPPVEPTLQVQAGLTTQADLTLDDAKPLVSGAVLEPDALPSPFAMVLARDADDYGIAFPADETGQFQFPSEEPQGGAPSPPGTIDVTAHNGGRLGRLSGVAKGTSGVTVHLSPGGALQGTVSGEPAPSSVVVQVATLDEASLPGMGGRPEEFQGTSFNLPEVPATAVRVSVTASDGRTGSADANVPLGGTAQVTVELTGSGSLSGRVVGPGGKPVRAAMFALDMELPHAVQADGSFRLSGLTVGQHTLRAFAPGTSPFGKAVLVVAGQTQDLGDLVLTPSAPH
jgi:hypothetical protein